MKRIIAMPVVLTLASYGGAILLAVATVTGTCTKWSKDKTEFGYRYVTERFVKVNNCTYVNPFSKDTVYLGSDDKFHLNKP